MDLEKHSNEIIVVESSHEKYIRECALNSSRSLWTVKDDTFKGPPKIDSRKSNVFSFDCNWLSPEEIDSMQIEWEEMQEFVVEISPAKDKPSFEYEIDTEWKGKNYIIECCGTKYIGGSESKYFYLSLFMAVLSCFVICITFIPRIPWFTKQWHIIIALGCYILTTVLTIIYGLKTHFTDPGFLRRNDGTWECSPRRDGDRYCGTCGIYRPSHAIHCQNCDACVYMIDHHCPWSGTCIGLRNIISFLLYTIFGFLMSIQAGFYVTIVFVHGLSHDMFSIIIGTFLMTAVLFFGSFSGIILFFASRNICINSSNVERVRLQRGHRFPRENKGCLQNCANVCLVERKSFFGFY